MIWETPDGLRAGRIVEGTITAIASNAERRTHIADCVMERHAREYLHEHHHYVTPGERDGCIGYVLIDWETGEAVEDAAMMSEWHDTYAEALIAGVLKIAEGAK